jgi:hypothetical protein
LTAAFDRALADPDNPAIAERVMAGIIRRQRQRSLILGIVGTAAALLVSLSALPLLGTLEAAFAGFASGVPLPEGQSGLPVLMGVVAAGIAAGWLLLEEAF